VDAFCRYRCTRNHDEHERSHDQCKHDHHDVLDKGHQIPNLHGAVVDADPSEPDDGDDGHVHDQHHHRHQESHDFIDFNGDIGQFTVGFLQAFFFFRLAVKCADDPDPRQIFTYDQVQAIQTFLDFL